MSDEGRASRLLQSFADAGPLGDVLVGSLVGAIAAFVLLAFRVHPVITASISTGLVVLAGFCVYLLLRRLREGERPWRLALDVVSLMAVALAVVAIAFLSRCSCT